MKNIYSKIIQSVFFNPVHPVHPVKNTAPHIFALLLAVTSFSAAQDLELEIMSFNIQQPNGTNWDARRGTSAALLAQEMPDIAGTQEAVNYQRDYLMENVPGYSWYGFGRDGGDNGEGTWIFYKTDRFTLDENNSGNFWLSNTPDSPSRFGGSYNRICTYARFIDNATSRGFYLFNTHFYMTNEDAYRMQAAELIADAIASRAVSGDPAILTGDFNSPEDDAVTQWFKNGGNNPVPMRDTYRDIDPTGYVTTGFGTKLDYIYVEDTQDYEALDSWVISDPAGASDHMPISAVIRLTGEVSAGFAAAGAATSVFQVSREQAGLRVIFNQGEHSGRISVLDMTGKTVQEQAIFNGTSWHSGPLPSGRYFLQFSSGNGDSFTEKTAVY